jgi:single-strand DNA-binding protein
MNLVCLIGNLGQTPELRTVTTARGERSVTRFLLAVDRPVSKDSKQEGKATTNWVPIVSWGRQAEVLTEYMTKGAKVGVAGHLLSEFWERRDGKNSLETVVVADRIDFLSSPRGAAPTGKKK